MVQVRADTNDSREIVSSFYCPPPVTRSRSLFMGPRAFSFHQDDFSVSFVPFLRTLPPELQVARPAIETNR